MTIQTDLTEMTDTIECHWPLLLRAEAKQVAEILQQTYWVTPARLDEMEQDPSVEALVVDIMIEVGV